MHSSCAAGAAAAQDHNTLQAMSPDANGYLQALHPTTWAPARAARIAPRVPLHMFSMWACLLGGALQLPGAREWAESPAAPAAYDTAASTLLSETGVAPSPTQIVRRALSSVVAAPSR